MKLVRLLLQAFGPFTNTEIVFSTSDEPSLANLHLIYGPNEAGKSSALRAMTDLRFGIPQRSPDNFLHPYNQLRVGGVFRNEDGELLGLVRHKGRGATLSRMDTATGQPTTSPEVQPEYERALTAGLARDEFEAMFGLNHARLRAGGDRLLKGEGELGLALFEASAGTRGIAAILAGLETDAKTLFNPHGRAQSATINEARRQLDEQRSAWRQAQVRPADWQTLKRAHEQARDALAKVDQALEAKRRRENELTELRTVEPLLREHDRTVAELERFAGVPDLPENAREDRLAAEQGLRRAREDLRAAELDLTRCTAALDTLVIEAPLLEHAEAIERLAANVEAAARSRIEAGRQQAIIEQISAELTVAKTRAAPERTLEEILNVLPSAADRVALNHHLGEISRLGERLDGYRNRAEELEQAAQADAGEGPNLPDPGARQTLMAALRDAQALGDISRQNSDLDRDIRMLDAELTQALSDLGADSTEALRSARPLLASRIAGARKELTDINEATRKLRDEDRLVEGDLEKQRLRQRQLAAAGEVVTAETLRLARERRDGGWALIRQAYVERSHDVDQRAATFDPDRPLPEAFEAAQGDADRQADLLRADATRAAGYEECVARIDEMERRRRKIATELTALTAERQALQEGWARELAQARLPHLDPEALRDWQAARAGTLDIAGRLERAIADRDRLFAETRTAADSLVCALQGVEQPAQHSALSFLVDQAARWERSATAAEAEHGARARSERNRRAECKKLNGLITKTEAEFQCHIAAVQTWHARLFLPEGSEAEAVKSQLDELDSLARQATTLSEARLRQAHQQVVVDDFANQAGQLAAVLREPPPRLADDFADRLRGRLSASRQQEQQRLALMRERHRALDKKRHAEAEQKTQSANLAQLCAAAGVEQLEQLPEREDRATRKRLTQITLATQQQQLAQVSTRPEPELRARLAGRDTVAIDGERERCRAAIAHLEQQQNAARHAEEQARRALEAIDSSDRAATAREGMESAAARFRSAIRPWARLKLAHALLREALHRFRERAQAPMVAAASTYFSLISGGRYQRLVVDEADAKPLLRAERADGARVGVEAMSDGTADQLYLALRLAALQLRRASHPQMPLVLDDVLITSDDQRVANILHALARFAEGGQVMLFTHHRHLIEVARTALGTDGVTIHRL